MTTFGRIGIGGGAEAILVEAADASILQDQVNAALASLDDTRAITAMTLAGSGDGHTFVVILEHAPVANVTGGLFGVDDGIQVTLVRCWLAADEQELARAKTLAGSPASGPVGPYGIVDEQMAGGSKGQRFMGMTIFVLASVGEGPLTTPFARALVTSTQALGAGETILAFDTLASGNQFTLPAPQTLRYTGPVSIFAAVDASVTVGLTAEGDFTADIVTDPLGTPSVIGTMTGHVDAGDFDNVSVLAIAALIPPSVAPSQLGVRVTSAAGSVLSATLRAFKI